MSKVIVVGFADEQAADAFKSKLDDLGDQGALKLEDAVKVTVGADGTPSYDHQFSLARGGAVFGGILGGLVGMFFLSPIAGAALGVASGSAVGKLAGDYGVEETFIEEVSRTLKPGAVALFVQGVAVDLDAVEAAVAESGGTIISMTLAKEARQVREAMDSPEDPSA